MKKHLKGFIATPFILVGGTLFFIGMVIVHGLLFTTEYLEVIKKELEKMKKVFND